MTDLDLFDPSVQENWYPTYDRLRVEAPVFRIPRSDLYVVTRYEDCMHVLRHQDVFPTGAGTLRHPAAREVYERDGWPRWAPLSTNPPEHRAYRALIDGFFDPTGSQRWAGDVETTVHGLIDEFVDDGRVELVRSFAEPLPVRMITRILGFPANDIPQLMAWSEAWVRPFDGGLSEDEEVAVAVEGVAFQRYIAEHAAAKRTDPGDDVLSTLVGATFDDPASGPRTLTDREVVSIVDHLYIGGNETTTFAITSAIWLLLQRPDLLEILRTDPDRIDDFIEEALRVESPTQGLYRAVAVDTAIAGVPVRAGSTVHIRYGAANRDPEQFVDPARIDLDRSNRGRHMAFSLGEHHCPGAGLSRLEQRVAIAALIDRLPDLHFTPDANDFTHRPGFVLRALRALDVSWDVSDHP